MANNYPDDDGFVTYTCACGETLTLEAGQILDCCLANGWARELED